MLNGYPGLRRPAVLFAAAASVTVLAAAFLWAAEVIRPYQVEAIPRGSVRSLVEVPDEPIQPIPLQAGLDSRKVDLGRRLFGDRRLSRDGSMSCASCHRPSHGYADDVAFTMGVTGRHTAVNVPTVRNSRYSVAQFWDGRAATLEAQVDGPLLNPDEMGSTWPEVIARLTADRGYGVAARAIYDAPLSPDVVRDAIAEFERSLASDGGRFDMFLRGQADALSEDEKAGYRLFKEYGCSSCHQGVAVGGNMFQRMSLFGDYFADRGKTETPADLGRFNVTGLEQDRHVFKVPSLREAANTAPYFHDGSAETLEAAIAVMARYQLGRDLPAADIERIAAFLRTLAADTAKDPG
jgi:cytochrome c peroxidase